MVFMTGYSWKCIGQKDNVLNVLYDAKYACIRENEKKRKEKKGREWIKWNEMKKKTQQQQEFFGKTEWDAIFSFYLRIFPVCVYVFVIILYERRWLSSPLYLFVFSLHYELLCLVFSLLFFFHFVSRCAVVVIIFILLFQSFSLCKLKSLWCVQRQGNSNSNQRLIPIERESKSVRLCHVILMV